MTTIVMLDIVAGLLTITALAANPVHGNTQMVECKRSEAVVLRTAPPSVRRLSPDRLRIEWAKGTHVFVNSGSAEDELAGLQYEYCGFVQGYHLIGKIEDAVFTGVLLDAASGKVLPAGHTVNFAPDGARYFAIQQPDGRDGEDWMVYSRDGSQLWMGVSGITRMGEYEYFNAMFEEPRWSAEGELEATLRCTVDTTKTATITLRASEKGYLWTPTIECPP